VTFPRLNYAKRIALDFETHDEHLKELGPGPRRGATILCASVSDGETAWSFPHTPELYEWLNVYAHKDWIFANALYDLDFAHYQGFTPLGNIYDVQIAEPLIDEFSESYALEKLAQRYVGLGKATTDIDWFVLSHGLKGDPRSHLHRMPLDMVLDYAKEDALLTHQIFTKQEAILREKELWPVFLMESELLKLLLRMRVTGVRVDEEKIERTIAAVQAQWSKAQRRLVEIAGEQISANSAKQIATVFDRLKMQYGYTEAGNPSFTAAFLENHDSELSGILLQVRQLGKLDGTFLTGMKRFIVNGRIHTQFHPMRTDNYGTISGRLSSSKPNLQQIPARQEFSKKAVRGLFIPEDGHDWVKIDYSQIEQRLLVHYARGRGAPQMQQLYRDNPDTDFHTETARLANVPRSLAKTINFGINYGMGPKKLAQTLGVPKEDAYEFLSNYRERLPFLKTTFQKVEDKFVRVGYIRTISGRRAHYHGSASHVALNRLIQGSAADVMKQAMVNAYRHGIFETIVPHLTVHDEIDVSVPRTKEGDEALKELQYTFENVYQLRVPLRVDMERGPDWSRSYDRLDTTS
jgi:DNA polymerase I-like protein with 3'-5' exonuclease and polymerase domains